MDLNYNSSACHCVVMHIRVKIREAAGREVSHFAFIKVVTHANFECP